MDALQNYYTRLRQAQIETDLIRKGIKTVIAIGEVDFEYLKTCFQVLENQERTQNYLERQVNLLEKGEDNNEI
jgi:hypothetical protein